MNLFNLTATIDLNDSGFTEGVRRAGENMQVMANKAKTVGGAIDKFVKGALVAGAGALATFTTLGVKNNAMLEQSGVAWETLLGSQEASAEMLERINKYAASTPFTKMGVDTMAKQLHNAGFRGQELFDQLTKIGDMGSAFGVQEDSLKEMVRQYAQVQQAGVAYTEDLNILQDRGIPIYKALSETLGVAVADVKKLTSDGQVSAEVYNQALESIANSTQGAMEAQSKTFNGLMSTVQDNIVMVIQKLSEPIFDKFKEGLQTVAEVVDKADVAVDIFNKSLDEGKGMGESFSIAIKGAFGDDVYNNIQNIGSIIYYTVGAIGAFRVALLGMQIATTVATFFSNLSSAIALYKTGVGIATAIQTAFNLSIGLIPIIIGVAVGAIALLSMYVVKNWETIKSKTLELWNNLKNFVTNMKDAFVAKIKQMVASVVTYFKELPNKMREAFESAKQAIITKLQEWGSAIGNFFTQTLPAVFQQLWDWFNQIPYMLGYALTYAIASIVKFVMDSWNYLTTAIPALIESISNWFSQLPGRIYQWLIETKNRFVTWTTELSANAQQSFSNLISGIVNWFKELPGRIYEWLMYTKDRFMNWFTDMKEVAINKMGEVANNIVNAVKELPSKMLEIGQWIVEGLWNGIANAGNWLKDKVKGFFAGVVDGAKAVFDIHSPSKVFKQIGVWNVEGLAIGMEKEMPTAQKVMDDGMRSIIPDNKPQAGARGIENTTSGNNYNVTVNYTGKVENELELNRRIKNDFRRLALGGL